MKEPPKLTDMNTWTDRTGHTSLRSFTDKDGSFWLEQNTAKRSKWAKFARAKFAREGHDLAWEFAPGGGYRVRMLTGAYIDTCGRDDEISA